jgi:pilus assembly protein Flp/PilA
MLRRFLSRFRREDSGATAIEYGLILALMCLVIIGALGAFGVSASGLIIDAMDTIRTGMASPPPSAP